MGTKDKENTNSIYGLAVGRPSGKSMYSSKFLNKVLAEIEIQEMENKLELLGLNDEELV